MRLSARGPHLVYHGRGGKLGERPGEPGRAPGSGTRTEGVGVRFALVSHYIAWGDEGLQDVADGMYDFYLREWAREAGAENVLWVWSPHVAYQGYEVYWPGDGYVDWTGTAALNYGTVAYWSQRWSFDQIFGRHYDFLAGFGKPIMGAESGTIEIGGERSDWYRGPCPTPVECIRS